MVTLLKVKSEAILSLFKYLRKYSFTMNTIKSTAKRTAVVFPKHKKVLSILGENLTLAMKRRGITQEMLHDRTGLFKQTLRKS